MLEYKCVIYFILLVTSSLCEEPTIKKTIDAKTTSSSPRENIKLRRSLPYTDTSENEPTFVAKLGDWLFPFGGPEEHKSDQIPESTGYIGPHYLPAPHEDSTGYDQNCHSCNQIPWVPVVGHKKIEYAPSYEYSGHKDIHSGEHLSGLENAFSSSTNLFGSPASQFNQKVEHGLAFTQQLPAPGAPPSFKDSINIPVGGDIFIADYMLPPPIHFRIPTSAYGPPKPNYDSAKPIYGVPRYPNPLPPRPSFGPTASAQYGPSSQDFTPPPGSDNRPRPQLEYGPPKYQYGSPPADGVLPPPRPTNVSFSNPQYGPPRPFPQYGPPPAGTITPPPGPTNGSTANSQYGPPRPFLQYGPPSGGNIRPTNGFSSPNRYEPPSKPAPSPFRPVPRPGYGPPASNAQPQYGFPPQSPSDYLPPPNYGPPPVFNYGHPPPPSYGPPNVTPIPVLLPPPVTDHPGQQDESSQFLQIPFESVPTNLGQFQPSSSVEPNSHLQLDSKLQPPVPSDSYGNAVTGESLHYALPTDTVHSSSSDRDVIRNPPNLPNFDNLRYEFRNFDGGISSQNSENNLRGQQNNNVEIQPSVQVANYLASIEHPVSVVQSPLFEVSVQDDQNFQNNEARPTSLYNQITEDNQKNYDQHSNNNAFFKLSENPIVVEDTYTASSNINNSFTSSNDTNVNRDQNFAVSSLDKLNDIAAISNAEDEEDLIKKLLLEKGILGNPSTSVVGIQKIVPTSSTYNLTPPSVDYSNWIPTNNDNGGSSITSMVPPAENMKSVWLQQISVTAAADKRKPLQIIVPYTTNKKISQVEHQWTSEHDLRNSNDGYTTLIPTYMPPLSTEESNWSKFLEDFKLAQSNGAIARPFMNPTTAVYNIKDLLTASYEPSSSTPIKLPYDVISLQKNIDDWTHQSFSRRNQEKNAGFSATKNIPNNFFSTQTQTFIDGSTPRNDLFDHDLASSNKKESVVKNSEIETNLISDEDSSTARSTSVPSTTSSTPITSSSAPTARKFQRTLWDEKQITLSPHTKEKVYVVTPQSYSFYTTPATAWSTAPRIENGRANSAISDSQKFAVRFEPQDKDAKKSKQKEYSDKTLLKVVYSEWPHIINNLQATTEKPTSAHPLLGSMSISEYIPPLNFSALETIVGYSKVATVMTTPSTPKKTDDIANSITSTTRSV